MAENKTQPTDRDPVEFLQEIEDESRRSDCLTLLELFESITQRKPRVWSNGTVGFGTYHYKSDRSAQEGEWMATGFSSRQKEITIYLMSGVKNYSGLLEHLGKYRASAGSCLYVRRLSDLNRDTLETVIRQSFADLAKNYTIE